MLIHFHGVQFFEFINQTKDSSGEEIEGNSRNIRASPPNLKIPYIVKKKRKKKLSEKVVHINC